jgi:hypothetical protein
METTDILLVILVGILSVLTVIWLIAFITAFMLAKRLLSKMHRLADVTSDSMSLLRKQLAQRLTIWAIVRNVMKRR